MITSVTDSIPLNQEKHQPGDAPKWRALLHARGLTDAAIDRAGLRPERRGWLFPYALDGQAQRWKAYPGQRGPKALWRPEKPEDARFYDPAGDLAAHIAAAGGDLILAEGEPDVWACWSAGIFNVTATLHGAGTIPPWLVDELRRLEVRRVLTWPDRDSAGLTGAAKLRAALADSEILFEAHELPYELRRKHGSDIGNLLLDVGADQFAAALEACPPLDLPTAPLVTPLSADRAYTPPPGESSDLYERWCLEVEQAAIRAWQIAPPNAKQLSRKNFSSPYRDDRRPSAQWNYTAHGFTDYATGEFTNTKQVAKLLGLDSWEEWKARYRPAVSGNSCQIEQGAAAGVATRFPLGLPHTLNKRYLNAHRRVKVKSQSNAAAVDFLYHQIPAGALPDNVWLSAGGFCQLARAEGFDPSQHMITAGLDQLAAWGRVERLEVDRVEWLETEDVRIGKKCNLYTSSTHVYRLQFLVVPTTGPAPRVIYRFKPWPASLDAIARRWRILAREGRYADTPDSVQAEWGDLTVEEIALWDDWRAPLYEAWAAERQRAAEGYERDIAYLEADFERIRAGSYNPVTLPEGVTLRSARHYADALKVTRVAAAGEKGISTHRLAYETGRSYSAEVRARERVEVIAVPQTRTVLAEEVTDHQRACGLVLAERDGQAIVKAPSVEKLAAYATPEELTAAESVSQAQRDRGAISAEARRRERAREATPAAQFKPSQPAPRPETLPGGYSAPHVAAQYGMCPLPPDFKLYDAETGEVYEPRRLWKEGARWLIGRAAAESQPAAEVAEDSDMSGFIERSEPREYDETPEGAAPRPDATQACPGLPASAVGATGEQADPRADHQRQARDPGGLPSADRTGPGAVRAGSERARSNPVVSHRDRDPRRPGIGADRAAHRNGSNAGMGQGEGGDRARVRGRVDRTCEICGAPARELHLFGWLCADHAALPLAVKLAQLRPGAPRLWADSEQGGKGR